MSATYYSLPTPAGLAELAGGLADNQAVPFTHMAIGDGNGAYVVPDGRASLVHEVDRVAITSIRKHPDHPEWVVIEAAVPEDRGGYWIRELAIIGGRQGGITLAVGNHPAIEKPDNTSGAGAATILRMVVAFANAAVISLEIDPQAYVTLQTVLDQMAAHLTDPDPHPQYLTKGEADSFYDSIGLAADAIQQDAARLSAHVAAEDPHPQYTTAAEVGGAFTAHEGAADPHPQYMTQAEVDARILAKRAKRYFHTSF